MAWMNSLSKSWWVIEYKFYVFIWAVLFMSRMCNNYINEKQEDFVLFLYMMSLNVILKTIYIVLENISAAKYICPFIVLVSAIMFQKNLKNGIFSSITSGLIVIWCFYEFISLYDLECLN